MTSDNPILAISARAADLRRRGIDVIDLAAGEPDSPTPEHIVLAAVRAAQDPKNHRYGLADGTPELRTAIAEQLSIGTSTGWSIDDIVVTLGAKHALATAMQAILDPGDEVLVSAPGWPGHQGAVAFADGVTRQVPVHADCQFVMTVESLEAARTKRTRAVVIASPSNPTGTLYPAAALREIGAWALEHGIWVISDDIYDGFVFDSAHTHLLQEMPGARSRCIVVSGVSKAYSMTGWRIGWVAGPPDVIARVKLAVSRSITHAPLVTQVAALEALTGDQTALKHERERYARARRLLSTLLNSVPGVECAIPGGGLYVFPSVEGLLKSNDLGLRTPEELGRWLLDDAMIAVVPWDYFGSPDRLRMCFAVSNSVLEEALRRLAVAFSKLTGADIAVPLAVEHR